MSFKIFADKEKFLITNSSEPCKWLPEISGNFNRLYGYYFGEDDLYKNCVLTDAECGRLKRESGETSGLFSVVISEENNIQIITDPLVQYGLYYFLEGNNLSISNDLLLLSDYHEKKEMSEEHLFDQIAYQSPLRGLTFVKDLYAIQYDDLVESEGGFSYKPRLPLNIDNFSVAKPNDNNYNSIKYEDLIKLFIDRLNKRASILSKKYDEIHIQLTGGADSRLVLSSMLNHSNFYCYCYGDGSNQNRLFFDEIVNSLNLKKSHDIPFVGQSLSNSALIFKGLVDSNFRKLNNLNTYVNSDDFVSPEKCKVTGYYGANISGGVVLPPLDTDKNSRTNFIDKSYYTYHNYVVDMKNRHSGLRRAAFNDLFYINNRGPSHYGAHSIADNKKCNSYDILYDPINIYLVRSCPYDDNFIDRNAISIDLIYENHRMLALFPYDGRKIPKYRNFDDVPLINCFSGYTFPSRDVSAISYVKGRVDCGKYDILKKGDKGATIHDMLNYSDFDSFFEKYDFLKKDPTANRVTENIILYYALSFYYLNNYENIDISNHV